MKVSFEKVQAALVAGDITVEQFAQILVDNFGKKKTRQMLRRNLGAAFDEALKEVQDER